MSLGDEETPLLLNTNGTAQSPREMVGKYSIISGLVLFVALVGSVLVRIPFNLFTFHPIFATLFIVLVTEGVALLQPTSTAAEKRKGLLYHAVIQTTSYLSIITGFSFIFYNKIVSGKAHFESFHAKMGLFVFIYLLLQLVFGITIAFAPQVFGSVEKGKQLWKYHRVFGYILLGLVWITAQLGVRADYMYNNLYSPHLLWLHWVAVLLVFGGIASRVRLSKFGFTN